jgi:hypothetical protein
VQLISDIAKKHQRGVMRDPTQIPVADVLSVYLDDVAPNLARTKRD